MLEAYTTLGFLAAHTARARLGTLVTGVHFRHPGVLVKQVTTLDVLSGGRAWLGIGAGWYERESQGLGVPFPPRAERFERLEETLRIAHAMWALARSSPSMAGITSSRSRSTRRGRSASRTRRSWSAAAASRRRCAWSRGTRTRATCSRATAQASWPGS